MKNIIFVVLGFIVLCGVFGVLICVDPLNIILYILILVLILGCSVLGYCLSVLMRTSGIGNAEKTLKELDGKITDKRFKDIIFKLLFSMGFENVEKSENTLADFVCDKTYFLVRLSNVSKALIKEAEAEKEKLKAQTYILISFDDIDMNWFDTVVFWDKNRILVNIKKLLPHKNIIHPVLKPEKLTIGDLDFATENEFETECNKLVSLYYQYVRKEKDFYIYNIDDKIYGVIFIRAGKNKLNANNMEEVFAKIYGEGYSNALVITNGYFSDDIKKMSAKLQIDLWNRDNLIYMINR